MSEDTTELENLKKQFNQSFKQAVEVNAGAIEKFIDINVGDASYLVSCDAVSEIVKIQTASILPHTLYHKIKISHVRGKLIYLYDLDQILHDQMDLGDCTWVLRSKSVESIGLVCRNVNGLIKANEKDKGEIVAGLEQEHGRFCENFIKMKSGHKSIVEFEKIITLIKKNKG